MFTVAEVQTRRPVVALVGNPNSGKSSVFNRLTGSNQKIGNYPGVTVEKVSGTLDLAGLSIECVDVPGLYSMRPVSADESVAATVIKTGSKGSPPDLLVYVLDVATLERNLFFFSQIAELSLPVVVALTMTDMLEREGKKVDLPKLESMLGVPVVAVVAHKGLGAKELKAAISGGLSDPSLPATDVGFPSIVTDAVDSLRERFARDGIELGRNVLREALLGDPGELDARLNGYPELARAVDEERGKILGDNVQGRTIDAQARYAWAAKVERECVTVVKNVGTTITDRIDGLLTHRVFGLAFFLGLMFLVFQSIYTLAAPLMDLIAMGVDMAKGAVAPALAGTPVIQSMVVDGIITGIGAVVVFLPQICILFFCIAVLEGTGYLARAAFLMDRLLGWCGLNGRAFIPLLSSFACAIPGIMAARVMPDERSRIATIMVAPLMSCSARLPVYILLIGAFIEPEFGPAWAGFALFAMHFVGILVAIPAVYVLNKGFLKGKRLPFMLELPRYQAPRWRDVALTVYSRARIFLKTAGTIIFAMSIVIWALLFFPRSDAATLQYRADYSAMDVERRQLFTEGNYVAQQQLRDSYLGRFGQTIEPVFKPAGFDWRLTTGILAAFPAREVIIPALGIIFSLGSDVDEESSDLRDALHRARWPDGTPLMNPWNAISLMVFFALCCQCMATLATIKRETNSWKWPVGAFVYMTALAYIFAVAINQFGGPG